MRLTTMTDYAMRLLMYVAHRPGRLCTIAEVAEAYGISEAHLMKITHQLAVAGYLETVRGKGGGMRLAVPPKQVNLGAVVRRVEPDFALVECFAASNGCVLTGYCRLAGIFAGALDGFLGHLDRYSLADLVPDAQSRVSPTVGVPLPWPRERPAQQGRRAAAASGRNDQRLRRF